MQNQAKNSPLRMGSSKLELGEVWEPGQAYRPGGLTSVGIKKDAARSKPVVFSVLKGCMKAEYKGPLDSVGCRDLFEAVKQAAWDNPKLHLLKVIEDPGHRTAREARNLMKQMLPPDLRGRVALVWLSRRIDCDGESMRTIGPGADARLFGTPQYRHALAWLGVVFA